MSVVTVKDKVDGAVLATGETPDTVLDFEGNWYFDPSKVQMERLVVSERIYTCPYKGICFWIDLESPKGTVRNVAWVYRDPKPGYESIKDRIAFYKGTRQGTISES